MRCLLCLLALAALLLALLALLARIACMRRHASWYRHATIAFGAAGCPHRRCLPRLRVMPCVPSLRLIAGRSRLRQPLLFARRRSLRLLGHEVILLCELSDNFGRYFFDMGLCAGPRRRRGRPRARAWRTACRSCRGCPAPPGEARSAVPAPRSHATRCTRQLPRRRRIPVPHASSVSLQRIS